MRLHHLAALPLVLAAAPVLAQHQVTVGSPWSTEAQLASGDARDEANRPYQDHALRIAPGQRIRISAVSEDFDTMLELRRAGGDEPVASDDDGGEDLNALLPYTSAEGGDYSVRVLSFRSEGAGRYMLGVEEMPPLAPPREVAMESEPATWSVYRGTLSAQAPTNDEGRHYDDISVTFTAGEETILRLDSEDFDPMIEIYTLDGRDSWPVASDDDGGDGLNAMLSFTAEQSGPHVVRVTSFGRESTGAYRLRIGR